MPALPKALFFDLDGTLVDSVPDLAWAVDSMLAGLGLAQAGESKVRLWVGNGARKLVQRALAFGLQQPEEGIEIEFWNKAHHLFLHHYGESGSRHTRVYPQVIETLLYLQARDIRMAIITNKPQQFTPHLLESLSLAGFFELVICGDTLLQQKPAPEPLLYAMNRLGLGKEDCWMVGDSRNDIDAAISAGICSVCVTYGYSQGENAVMLPATLHINEFGQLRQIFS